MTNLGSIAVILPVFLQETIDLAVTFHATTSSVQNSATTTYAANLPAYNVGDIVFLHITNYNPSAVTPTVTATGWTSIDQGQFAAISYKTTALLYRIMNGTEGTSVTLTGSNALYWGVQATSYQSSGTIVLETPVIDTTHVGVNLSTVPSLSLPTLHSNSLALNFHTLNATTSGENYIPTTGIERYDSMCVINFQNQELENSEQINISPGYKNFGGTTSFGSSWRDVLIEVYSAAHNVDSATISSKTTLPSTETQVTQGVTFHAAVGSSQDSTTTTYSVTLPAYSIGDIVFIHVTNYNPGGSAPTISATGWTSIDQGQLHSFAFQTAGLLYRIMDGTEGTSVILTSTFSNSWGVYAISYQSSGAISIGTPVIDTSHIGSSTTTVPSISLTTLHSNSLAVNFHSYYAGFNDDNYTPTTGIERYDTVNNISSQFQALENSEQANASPGSKSFGGTTVYNDGWRDILLEIYSVSANIETVTVSSKTILSSTELAASIDTAIISSKTAPSGTDTYTPVTGPAVDAATVTGKTTPSAIELFTPFTPTVNIDPATITTTTTILVIADEWSHPTGMWGPYDTDSGDI